MCILPYENASHYFAQQEEIKSKTKVELEMLRDVLGLKTIPKRMECIDISNTVKQLLWPLMCVL